VVDVILIVSEPHVMPSIAARPRGHADDRKQQQARTCCISHQLRRGRMRPPRQIVFDGMTDEHNSQKRGIDRTVEDRKEVEATGVLGVREDDGAKARYERKDDIGCYAPCRQLS